MKSQEKARKRDTGKKDKIFEEIWAENFPKLLKLYNPYIQEAQAR